MTPDLFSIKPAVRYPNVPGARNRDTSRAAAGAIAPKAATIRNRILACYSGHNLTADEACAMAGVHINTGRPRVAELAHENCRALVDSGIRRQNASGKSAIVWRLA